MNPLDAQRILRRLGLYSGGLDGDWGPLSKTGLKAFQTQAGLKASGALDADTVTALAAANLDPDHLHQPIPASTSAVPAAWMPSAEIARIIVHWTAGKNKASANDLKHYHLLIEDDGAVVRGVPTIDKNDARGAKGGYAAHTLNCNTGSIGVSLCCMGNAVEQPFQSGPWPMTKAQWQRLPAVLADLCRRYNIQPSAKTVLSHAEVQDTLGIHQRGKWDVSRLSFDPAMKGARAVGDVFRAETLKRL